MMRLSLGIRITVLLLVFLGVLGCAKENKTPEFVMISYQDLLAEIESDPYVNGIEELEKFAERYSRYSISEQATKKAKELISENQAQLESVNQMIVERKFDKALVKLRKVDPSDFTEQQKNQYNQFFELIGKTMEKSGQKIYKAKFSSRISNKRVGKRKKSKVIDSVMSEFPLDNQDQYISNTRETELEEMRKRHNTRETELEKMRKRHQELRIAEEKKKNERKETTCPREALKNKLKEKNLNMDKSKNCCCKVTEAAAVTMTHFRWVDREICSDKKEIGNETYRGCVSDTSCDSGRTQYWNY